MPAEHTSIMKNSINTGALDCREKSLKFVKVVIAYKASEGRELTQQRGVESVECGAWNMECGVWNVECAV